MAADLLQDARWECASVEPGSAADPAAAAALAPAWLPAPVPGTAAGAVRAAGRDVRATDFDANDWWFRTRVTGPAGEYLLRCDGLATVAEVWIDGRQVLRSESMFRKHVVAIDLAGGDVEIAIRCVALAPLLRQKRPRPRWRSGLVATQGLRWWRTTLLGRMPGWAAYAQPVGPWRPVRLQCRDAVEVTGRSVHCHLVGGVGIVDLQVTVASAHALAGGTFRVGSAGADARSDTIDGITTLTASVRVDGVDLWWPHTHGSQPLYPLSLHLGSETIALGTVGFRTMDVDLTDGAFTLSINGVQLFARGACWVPPDPIGLNPPTDFLRTALGHYVDAGFNVVRVSGTMTYETPEFWALCAELGLLVWQDCMFATLDPPADADFEAAVVAELSDVFTDLQGCPALAVISGGSETEQQPAMLGLDASRRTLPLLEETIPALASLLLPGVPYVTSSPSGGVPPTRLDTGVSHYFGVGAYQRPLSDARTSGLRFAAECLAFAIPPEAEQVAEYFGSTAVSGQPSWKAAVPRDQGASWDFEDVTAHYVRTSFGVDPAELRRSGEHARALDFGRAAIAHVTQSVFAEWRRAASPCAGGIVLSMRDLYPGAGWGLIDSSGSPKAPWYALSRVLAPVAVFVTDEGLDGVAIHVANDRPDPLTGTLHAQLFGISGLPLESLAVPIAVPAHGAQTFSLLELLGEFRDLNHAYQFGPPTYDALRVALTGPEGHLRSEATHLLRGQVRPLQSDVALAAVLSCKDREYAVTITTRDLAQWVAIDCPGYQATDSWFHLAPGQRRSIGLRPTEDVSATARRSPTGSVRALNSLATAPVLLP